MSTRHLDVSTSQRGAQTPTISLPARVLYIALLAIYTIPSIPSLSPLLGHRPSVRWTRAMVPPWIPDSLTLDIPSSWTPFTLDKDTPAFPPQSSPGASTIRRVARNRLPLRRMPHLSHRSCETPSLSWRRPTCESGPFEQNFVCCWRPCGSGDDGCYVGRQLQWRHFCSTATPAKQ